MSLDRLQSSLALVGVKPPTVEVNNTPPQVLVSYSPAILVPIDGAPVLKPVPNHTRWQRVINTRALILQGGLGNNFYIHVFDGWLSASSINGPWTQATLGPFEKNAANDVAQALSKAGDRRPARRRPQGQPEAIAGQRRAHHLHAAGRKRIDRVQGPARFRPIVGTSLLWASNTTSDVLIDTTNNNYYVLLSGRWFSGTAMTGPWTFVPSNALPQGFAKIPPSSLAGAVLPTVAGTPEAQVAIIENSIRRRPPCRSRTVPSSRRTSTVRRSIRRSRERRFRTSTIRRCRSSRCRPTPITR
jgi:hypothetical protein